MKNPDEIKKGLAAHVDDCCSACTYWDDCHDYNAMRELAADALAYIQQLETDGNAALMRMIDEACDKISTLEAELSDERNNHQHTIDIAEKQKEQIQKLKDVVVRLSNERDAAVSEIVGTCQVCEWEDSEKCASCHFNTDAWNAYESNWQWRGVQKP